MSRANSRTRADRGAKKSRVWSALWGLAAIPIGFALGAWSGARLLVPDNAGLTGGAMVVWYGALGGLLALVVSIVAIRLLDASRLKPIALVLVVLAAGVLTMAGLAVTEQHTERDAELRKSMAMLPSFELTLAGDIGASLRRFAYASATNDWRIQRVDGVRCSGALPAGRMGDRSRLELLGALRGLDVAGVLVEPPACARAGDALATLELQIFEHKPPPTSGNLTLTQACRARIPQVGALFERVVEIYRRHGDQLDCR